MGQKEYFREELFIAGLGGMGVLFAGSLLASVAFNRFKYVTWLPSYGVQPRGGLSECTVIFSEERIPSPVLDQAKTVILIDGTQYKVMEPRVRPGGLMILDNSGYNKEKEREDIRLLPLPAMETAVSTFGQAGSTNLILLGAYIAATEAMPAQLINDEMERRFRKKEDVLKRNKIAFERGLELGQG